jgi:hypothetical protein
MLVKANKQDVSERMPEIIVLQPGQTLLGRSDACLFTMDDDAKVLAHKVLITNNSVAICDES